MLNIAPQSAEQSSIAQRVAKNAWHKQMPQHSIYLTELSKRLLTFTFLLLILVLLNACATISDDDAGSDSSKWSEEKLYTAAKRELKAGDYQLAIEYLETLESKYPFGKYAEQAQIETAYAYYKYDEYDNAIAAANRFIKLHPRHSSVDYAYYLRGLASFHKKDTPMDSLLPQDPSQRDPSSTRESFLYFAEVVKKFPNSKYAQDSIQKMKYQRNMLAKHELNVANYYFRRGAYIAAVNRAKYIVENYPKTASIPHALSLLNKSYSRLDMDDLAEDSKHVLELNYPDYNAKTSNKNEDVE